MKKSLVLLLSMLVTVSLVSCNNDDDDDSSIVEANNGIFQAVIDDAIVEDFLENYTYNDLEMAQNDSFTDQDIKFYRWPIDESLKEKSSGIKLSESENINMYNFTYNDTFGNEVTNQPYYVVTVREGIGKSVHETDLVNITYQTKVILTDDENNARLLETNKQNLDSLTTRNWFSNTQFVDGFTQSLSKFKVGGIENEPCSVFEFNENGEAIPSNFGIGIAIIPSGLAFFNTELFFNDEEEDEDFDIESDEDVLEEVLADTFAYRNFVFTFSTYNALDQDSDGDGIPNVQEDLVGVDINEIDTDNDEIPNYFDTDDDNDNILTRNEIFIGDEDLIDNFGNPIPFDETDIEVRDSDCDGVYTNDSDILFLYTNLNSTSNSDKVIYAKPGELIDSNGDGINEYPYHLDANVRFNDN